MGSHDGAIDDQMLHIRVIGKMLMHLGPNTVVVPASKALVDTIPVAVLFRQQAPLGTAAGYPQYGFDKAPALTFLSYVSSGTVLQEIKHFLPLVVS